MPGEVATYKEARTNDLEELGRIDRDRPRRRSTGGHERLAREWWSLPVSRNQSSFIEQNVRSLNKALKSAKNNLTGARNAKDGPRCSPELLLEPRPGPVRGGSSRRCGLGSSGRSRTRSRRVGHHPGLPEADPEMARTPSRVGSAMVRGGWG